MSKVKAAIEATLGRFQPEKAKGSNITYTYEITGDGGGTFSFKINDGICELIEGPVPDAAVTFTMSSADFLRIQAGQLDGWKAFILRKIKLKGDLGLASQFKTFFPEKA